MIREEAASRRTSRTETIEADLVVVGGGVAGVCCAITAARAGLRVALVQDRPVLGGNASSEVRLWVLGATAHMGSNARWAREGGVINEILVENLWRNPEGNPCIMDTVLLEKVVEEPNIRLLLNTAVFEVEKSGDDTIAGVSGFNSQNSTLYHLKAPLFVDSSGDGIVGFLSGAAFRMGAESQSEFGEKFAPDQEYGELLGHSMYFYSKRTDRPVKYVAPSFALKDITVIPRYRDIGPETFGCRFWWFEYGGRLDTVHKTEDIKWELWKVVYGVWDYIKNSGKFPDADNMTLEWVSTIPGKRESRRFEGDYILTQQDVIEQRQHVDAVSFGGWAIDLHPADGVYSDKPGCTHWRSKGVYQIPYRCMYSRNIRNLFLVGRIVSSSHVAFGSTRVIGTCSHGGQAVAMAAAICRKNGLRPADLLAPERMKQLQREILALGQYIPEVALDDPTDLVRRARVSASSAMRLAALTPDGPEVTLKNSCAMMLPVVPGKMPQLTFTVKAAEATDLHIELRVSSQPQNHTPDMTVGTKTIRLAAGEKTVRVDFDIAVDEPRYAFVCLMANPQVSVRTSEQRLTGVLAVHHRYRQDPKTDIGVEKFEIWTPGRRPDGQNLAMTITPPLDCFGPANMTNGLSRPTRQPNAWVAALEDPNPTVKLQWDQPQTIARIELSLDGDFDHPMESVLFGQPERVVPFCVREYIVRDGAGRVLAHTTDNHQTRNTIRLDPPAQTDTLMLELKHPMPNVPAALFEIRCYAP